MISAGIGTVYRVYLIKCTDVKQLNISTPRTRTRLELSNFCQTARRHFQKDCIVIVVLTGLRLFTVLYEMFHGKNYNNVPSAWVMLCVISLYKRLS